MTNNIFHCLGEIVSTMSKRQDVNSSLEEGNATGYSATVRTVLEEEWPLLAAHKSDVIIFKS